MSTDDLTPTLSAWLAATDIGYLELRGPGMQLCLHNDAGRIRQVPVDWLATSQAATVPVLAPSVGVFLHSHPAQSQPLAHAGQAVECGQIIGLLRIGALLLPVAAPQAGTLGGSRVASGTTVGYGTALFDLIPAPPV